MGTNPRRIPTHTLHYRPKARVFHIVAEIEDVPGSLSKVLGELSDKVDFANTVSYSSGNGRAVFSAFAHGTKPGTTREAIEEALHKFPNVKEVSVVEGEGGLVVNRLFSGMILGPGDPRIPMSIPGLNYGFDQLAKIFGSGAKMVLYGQGYALGLANGKYLRQYLGGLVMRRMGDMAMLYGSLGWGNVDAKKEGSRFIATVHDCFECMSESKDRTSCDFFRGHFTGSASSMMETKVTGEETKCKRRGNDVCEFVLTPSDNR